MDPRLALVRIGFGSALVPLLLLLANKTSVVIWLAAVLGGLTYSSWNSVGMLAIIQRLGPEYAGQGSGVVLLGFLTGLGIGAPLFGFSVDVLNSYRLGLWSVAGVFLAGMMLMVRSEPSR